MPAPHPGNNLRLDLSIASLPDREELPPLAALFLIYFDIKAGYTIAWSRTASGVDLDGVEFKSLPSGLHNLKEDLVYFVHGSYAGVSAFVNAPAAEEERNALMVSAGILVPLSYGRLGRSWRHAEGLKTLAQQFAVDPSSHTVFEEYYERHKINEQVDSPVESPLAVNKPRERTASISHIKQHPQVERIHARTRSVSEATTLVTPGQTLKPYHPALSLTAFVDTFGPLIFPLYRAALARKRILLMTSAPVEAACNFVYDISILSNIPLSATELLPTEPSRLKPLFNVGVHDIPFLEDESKRYHSASATASGWVACTTDDVLKLKTELYDVVVTLPPLYAKDAKRKVWPKIESPAGTLVRATQRDLRRYRALRKSLRRRYKDCFKAPDEVPVPQPPSNGNGRNEGDAMGDSREDDEEEEEDPAGIEDICEKLSWREIAYSGFIWWASAGEKRDGEDGEAGSEELLFDTRGTANATTPRGGYRAPSGGFGMPMQEDLRRRSSTYQPQDEDHDAVAAQPGSSSAEGGSSRQRKVTGAGGSGSSGVMRRMSTGLLQIQRNGLGSPEMDVVAYFHQNTQSILTTLADIIKANSSVNENRSPGMTEETEETEGEEEEEEEEEDDEATLLRSDDSGVDADEEEVVVLSLEDLDRMRLDRYSNADGRTVEELGRRWFGRAVEVERWRVRCCGIECG